jgi:immune inhibitor A
MNGRALLLLAPLLTLALTLSACNQPAGAAPPRTPGRAAVAGATSTPGIGSLAVLVPTSTATVRVTYGGAPKEAAPAPTTAPAPATAGPPPAPTATPLPVATASVADIAAQTPPRDLVGLAERLRHVDPVEAQPTAAPVDYPVGYQTTFNVADQVSRRYFPVTATVRVKTTHAYFYVQDDLSYDATGLQQAAEAFESHIYPTDTSIFGLPREPGIDGDRRISIVNANIPGVGGYFSSSDEYPASVVPYSNQRNAIYINAGAERIGSTDYLSTIAHEFQHMIHWNVRPHDDSWLNEGMSILAEHLNGYPVGVVVPLFLGSPDTQLDAWAADPQAAVPHYGAADLFLEYFTEHYGGPKILKELLASKATDLQMFSNYLRRHDPGTTLDDVFADWVVADELNNPTIAGGRYAYTNRTLHATLSTPPVAIGVSRHATVYPYAANYYEIPATAATGTLQFQGATSVPLMQQPPVAGAEWWGNRADTMDTTLTRAVDLRDVAAAELDFSLWMDIEDSYDYFYVEASQDGGAHWTTLPGTHSSTEDPNGQNYGNGYTGKSAEGSATPGWWQEQVDLSPYAGEQVLLRFEYVTDEAYSGPGVGLANIRIPATGYDDAADGHGGWTSSGWLLTDNRVPVQFLVQVIANGAPPVVFRLPLDADNRGSVALASLAQPGQSVVVAVSAMAPKTSEAGAYTLQIGQ